MTMDEAELPINCPCCGQKLPDEDTRISWDRNVITDGVFRVRLPYRESVILLALLRAWPGGVMMDQLMVDVYGRSESNNPQKLMSSYVAMLRRNIRPFEMSIENTRDRGYTLHGKPATIKALRKQAPRRSL